MTDGLLGVVQRLTEKVKALSDRTPTAPTWATVTALSPLRVRPDGSTAVLEATPDNLAGPLIVGARVMIQVHGRKVVVYGPGSNLVQHGAVTTNGDQIILGSQVNANSPTFEGRRYFSTINKWFSYLLYLANNPTNAEVGLLLRRNGTNMSRLALRDNCQLLVNDYTANVVRPLPFASASGVLAVTPTATNSVTTVTVTLPSNRFTQAPAVNVTPQSALPNAVFASVGSRSATSFQICLYRPDIAATNVNWSALQMEA